MNKKHSILLILAVLVSAAIVVESIPIRSFDLTWTTKIYRYTKNSTIATSAIVIRNGTPYAVAYDTRASVYRVYIINLSNGNIVKSVSFSDIIRNIMAGNGTAYVWVGGSVIDVFSEKTIISLGYYVNAVDYDRYRNLIWVSVQCLTPSGPGPTYLLGFNLDGNIIYNISLPLVRQTVANSRYVYGFSGRVIYVIEDGTLVKSVDVSSYLSPSFTVIVANDYTVIVYGLTSSEVPIAVVYTPDLLNNTILYYDIWLTSATNRYIYGDIIDDVTGYTGAFIWDPVYNVTWILYSTDLDTYPVPITVDVKLAESDIPAFDFDFGNEDIIHLVSPQLVAITGVATVTVAATTVTKTQTVTAIATLYPSTTTIVNTTTIPYTTTTTTTTTATKTQTVTTTAAPYPSMSGSWLLLIILILIVLAIIGIIKMASKSIEVQSTTFVKKK